MLKNTFFERDAQIVARELLGKVIYHKNRGLWLSAKIIETEAYYMNEKGSHASLGYTSSRQALFMPSGTIYMYYARGGDSLNISCKGEGNAVLIKSGIPYFEKNEEMMIQIMQRNNPIKNSNKIREPMRLCSGQTLLCKSLGITVTRWNKKQFDIDKFYIKDVGYNPRTIVNTKRLGIPKSRDEHLLYRYIDFDYIRYCTKNPIAVNKNVEGKDFIIIKDA